MYGTLHDRGELVVYGMLRSLGYLRYSDTLDFLD